MNNFNYVDDITRNVALEIEYFYIKYDDVKE